MRFVVESLSEVEGVIMNEIENSLRIGQSDWWTAAGVGP